MPNSLLFEKTLFIRMIFSALVDADWLDTEKFMNPEKFSLRQAWKNKSVNPLQEMNLRLNSYVSDKIESAPNSEINRLRKDILRSAEQKTAFKPGFFSLRSRSKFNLSKL